MPGESFHARKRQHDFDASKLIERSSTSFFDWQIITLFYSALHYVDYYLAKAYSKHPYGHSNRKDDVMLYLPSVERDYRILRALSDDARYHDVPIGQQELSKANGCYEQIRRRLTAVTCPGCGEENLINEGNCSVCKAVLA
jgi:hypothetical protein